MAGHSKFKNIQHRKGAQDKKRAKIFTRLVREIQSASKTGGPDPDSNPRLRTAISAAKSMNLPKERIERALSSNNQDSSDYIEIRYEGYAPGGVALVVEALTDNKNRTASDVRSSFTKYGGNLGETGSVSFMFDHLGIITFPANIASSEKILELAIESGAMDVESDEFYHTIYTAIEDYSPMLEKLSNIVGSPEEACIGWKPQNIITITEKEKAEKLLKLIDLLEESEDIQKVFGNYEFSSEIIEFLSN